MFRFLRFLRLFDAQKRRVAAKRDLQDTLFVEKQKAANQGGAADYWLQRDLQDAQKSDTK